MQKDYYRRIYGFLVVIVIVGVIFSGGIFAGYNHASNKSFNTISLQNTSVGKPAQVDFSPFWQAWSVLNEKHVATGSTTDITDQDKVWGAIEGLANSFKDPYTVFFPPEDASIFEEDIRGNFEGVGIEIGIRDGILTVVSPLKGTPAFRAGIKSGDKILKIDDKLTTNISSDEAMRLIRGKGGTTVKFIIGREGTKEPFEIKVVRDVINIPTIDPELRSDGIFVIKLYNFSSVSDSLFRSALREFILSGSKRLILDLRGNPGGYLDAAVDMASLFLPQGKVVVRENFGDNEKEQVFRSKGYDVFKNYGLSMVVLVNGGSASASEILAGALREHGVAKLVGTKTFGKGTVQELVKITPDTSLKITIAKWLTPNGLSISESGLKPDYEVKMTATDETKGIDPQLDKAVELLSGR